MAKKIDDVKVKSGRKIRVENTLKKKFSNAAKTYLAIWIEDSKGNNERCLLFTDKELERAEKRSIKNQEDLTNKGILTDLFD